MRRSRRTSSDSMCSQKRPFASTEWPDCAFAAACLLWLIAFGQLWRHYENFGATSLLAFAPVGLLVPLWTAARVRIGDTHLRSRLVREGALFSLVWAVSFLVAFFLPFLSPTLPETGWVLANPFATLIAYVAAAEAYHRWAFQGVMDLVLRLRRKPPEPGVSSGLRLASASRMQWWAVAVFVWATWMLPLIVVIALT
jgi:hypothetical protein